MKNPAFAGGCAGLGLGPWLSICLARPAMLR